MSTNFLGGKKDLSIFFHISHLSISTLLFNQPNPSYMLVSFFEVSIQLSNSCPRAYVLVLVDGVLVFFSFFARLSAVLSFCLFCLD